LEDYAIITHPSEMHASEEYEARDSSNGSIYSSNSLVNESSIPVEQRNRDLNKKGERVIMFDSLDCKD